MKRLVDAFDFALLYSSFVYVFTDSIKFQNESKIEEMWEQHVAC